MGLLSYSRDQLLALRSAPAETPDIPAELRRRRRRGCRAGVRRQMQKRRYKPCVPSVIMGNVRSLPNKMEELSALTRHQREYREASIICLTETWLNAHATDALVALEGFSLVRADRSARESGKRKGGGIALFINKKWCFPGHITVKEQLCSRHIELLAASLRPFYLPRDFSHVIALGIYIPPSADAAAACEVIHTSVSKLQTSHPQALFLISGDFNHVSLSSTLPTFTQYVTCHTRDSKTLDLMYANIKEAYTASPLPPLGRSDHNLVHLLPVYKPMVKRLPPEIRTVRRWTEEESERLRDCFQTTDWDVLCGPHGDDINSLTSCVTDYINFCVDNTVPVHKVKCYPNNKPWVTPEIKTLLKEKKRVFKSGDKEMLRGVQKELKKSIREGKEAYRRKMEERLQQRNAREVWRGLKNISGHGRDTKGGAVSGGKEWANELNLFFNRFDHSPPPGHQSSYHPVSPLQGSHTSCPRTTKGQAAASHPSHPSTGPLTPTPLCTPSTAHPPTQPPLCTPPPQTPTPSPSPTLSITVDQVRWEFRKIRTKKATGPDGISARLLRDCADQLCGVAAYMFNLSLSLERVPDLWKTSCVVPVPKIARPREPNHFRPVALTSHLIKSMERVLLRHLRPLVSSCQDPLQFAYQPRIGVEDAINYLLHRSLSHLETPGSTVRIMFFDFSSAFNTIRPSLLRGKLEGAGVDRHLAAWTIDYLTNRPQYVRIHNWVSDEVVCSTGAPQGTVMSPFLFTLYTADFRHNTGLCHLQKFSDDSAIVGYVSEGNDLEYRGVIRDFVDWCEVNHLQINTNKTKELVIDFHRKTPHFAAVNIQGLDIEQVESYKYLGVHLNNKLDWSDNTDVLYKKGQSRLHMLRRLRSFGVCRTLLKTFYDTVVASALLYAVICWGGGSTERDRKRLNRLVRRASSVLDCPLDSVEEVGERRMLTKLTSIRNNTSHPLHQTVESFSSSFSGRLRHPQCRRERYRRSFIPTAVRLFNTAL